MSGPKRRCLNCGSLLRRTEEAVCGYCFARYEHAIELRVYYRAHARGWLHRILCRILGCNWELVADEQQT